MAAAVGMVLDLLRVWTCEAAERRSAVAVAHRYGSLLREQSAADMAWMVGAAAASRHSGRRHVAHTGRRVVCALGCFCSAPSSVLRGDFLDGVSNWHHHDGELLLFELPRPLPRCVLD